MTQKILNNIIPIFILSHFNLQKIACYSGRTAGRVPPVEADPGPTARGVDPADHAGAYVIAVDAPLPCRTICKNIRRPGPVCCRDNGSL